MGVRASRVLKVLVSYLVIYAPPGAGGTAGVPVSRFKSEEYVWAG